jgi:hypothetical protein
VAKETHGFWMTDTMGYTLLGAATALKAGAFFATTAVVTASVVGAGVLALGYAACATYKALK